MRMVDRSRDEQVVHVWVELSNWSWLVRYWSVDDRVGGSCLNKNQCVWGPAFMGKFGTALRSILGIFWSYWVTLGPLVNFIIYGVFGPF